MTTLLFRTAWHGVSPASTRSLFAKAASGAKGTLRKVGKVSLYEEGRVLGHTPAQLYSVIADVDSYHSFLPFATSSQVLSAALRHSATVLPLAAKGWLKPPTIPNETWDLEAELHVGAMGYSEGYVSRIELQKYNQVIVRRSPFVRHFTPADSTLHTTGHCEGFNALQAPRHALEIDPLAALPDQHSSHSSRSLPRLRLCLALPRRRSRHRLGEGLGNDGRRIREASRPSVRKVVANVTEFVGRVQGNTGRCSEVRSSRRALQCWK